MGDYLKYKGYKGTVEYSVSDNILYGKVIDIDDSVSYEGIDVFALRLDFENAVDSYIDSIPPKKKTGQERVEYDSVYYTIDSQVTPIHRFERAARIDNIHYKFASYLSTQEKAEEINKKQTLWRKLQRFADENNKEFSDYEQYYIDIKCGELVVMSTYIFNNAFMQVYFSSQQITQQALETFKEELEEYFGIKK